MHDYIKERTIKIGKYIVETKKTVRVIAKELFRNDTNGFFRLHDILTNLDCSLFDVIVHTTRPPQLDVRSVK